MILDDNIVPWPHLRVISKNLPIHLRVCAKMFTSLPKQAAIIFDIDIITQPLCQVIGILVTKVCHRFDKSVPPFCHPLNPQDLGHQRRNLDTKIIAYSLPFVISKDLPKCFQPLWELRYLTLKGGNCPIISTLSIHIAIL